MTIQPGTMIQVADGLSRLQALRGLLTHWSLIGLFGATGWPWLLKSLHSGGLERRAELLSLVELADDALPQLGSWRADAGLLLLIANHILAARPRTIVEFGGGSTTLIAAKALSMIGGGRLVSFDQEPSFAAETKAALERQGLEAEIHAVPLKPAPPGYPGRWYAHGPLPDVIDMLIVDGPPWFVHPLGRGTASSVFDQISPGGVVFLDDAARPGERLVARRWRAERPDFDFDHVSGAAGTLIGTRRR